METDSPLSRLREPDFFPECWKTLLKGVVAFVDVRSGSDNRSKSIANEMERLGATVVSHFSKKVTHVIFKDGSKPIWDKAKTLGIPIVSYLWVVACKTKGEIVQTEDHPAINSQDYDSSFFKWRKVKSMQPKELDEELKLAERKLDRRRKKIPATLFINKANEDTVLPYTPISERKPIIDILIESSPMVQERIQQELAAGKSCDDVFKIKEEEEDDFDTFFDTPLMLKFISKNYYSPREPPPSSLRKILSEVRRNSSCNVSPTSDSLLQKETRSSGKKSVKLSPLSKTSSSPTVNKHTLSTGKRKRVSMSAVPSKRLKENADDDLTERLPRRKLLFQPKARALVPHEPLTALTPDESPKRTQNSHPCFAGKVAHTEVTRRTRRSIRRRSCSPLQLMSNSSPRRDSLADFKIPSPKGRKQPKVKTLVCTSIHSERMSEVEEAIKKIGGFQLSETVDDTTTLLVCGDARRTLNVMHGVVRGVNIVSHEWILDSLAAGKWLKETDYPVNRFSVAAALHRDRKRHIFKDFDPLYVSSKSNVPSRDLCEMIKCCGGNLTTISKKATLVVGLYKPQLNVPCVAGTWVLDCIEKGVTLPLNDYLLNN